MISEDYCIHEALDYAKDSLANYYTINGIPIDYRIDFREVLDDDLDLHDLIQHLSQTYNELYQAEEELDNYLDEKTLALKEFIELADGFITLKHYDDYIGAGDFITLYFGNEKIGFDLLDFVSAVNELLDKNHKLVMIDSSVTGEPGPKGVI